MSVTDFEEDDNEDNDEESNDNDGNDDDDDYLDGTHETSSFQLPSEVSAPSRSQVIGRTSSSTTSTSTASIRSSVSSRVGLTDAQVRSRVTQEKLLSAISNELNNRSTDTLLSVYLQQCEKSEQRRIEIEERRAEAEERRFNQQREDERRREEREERVRREDQEREERREERFLLLFRSKKD